MSTTRKILTILLIAASFCFVQMYVIGPAEAAASDEPNATLGPAPTNNPVARPTVKRAHRHGYIKACEPSRANGGSKISFAYGTFKLPEPDGFKFVQPGQCKLIRVHRHTIDWVAFDARTGAIVASGHVRHIHL